MASKDKLDKVIAHLESQLGTITTNFHRINPSLWNSTSKGELLSFAYLLNKPHGKWSLSNSVIPNMTFIIRTGILIGNTKRDAHQKAIADTLCDFDDWFIDWILNNNWTAEPVIESVIF